MSLFVDTSVWYAAADTADTANTKAKSILAAGDPLVTSDHVLVETWVLLRHRLDRRAADLEVAWELGAAFPNQDFSLVHRTSLAVMRRLGLDRAASFDHHFAVFRFGPNRRRAFAVVR